MSVECMYVYVWMKWMMAEEKVWVCVYMCMSLCFSLYFLVIYE